MKGKKENMFCELKSLLFFLLYSHYSFSFAFQRFFLELEVAFPYHFKLLKMKHKWWRSKEVIDDTIIIGDEQFYPTKVKPNINSIE